MSDGGWALWGVTIALPLVIAIAVVVVLRARRLRCATCRGRLAALDDPRMLRCRSCGAEVRRDARTSPSTGIPRARVHR